MSATQSYAPRSNSEISSVDSTILAFIDKVDWEKIDKAVQEYRSQIAERETAIAGAIKRMVAAGRTEFFNINSDNPEAIDNYLTSALRTIIERGLTSRAIDLYPNPIHDMDRIHRSAFDALSSANKEELRIIAAEFRQYGDDINEAKLLELFSAIYDLKRNNSDVNLSNISEQIGLIF